MIILNKVNKQDVDFDKDFIKQNDIVACGDINKVIGSLELSMNSVPAVSKSIDVEIYKINNFNTSMCTGTNLNSLFSSDWYLIRINNDVLLSDLAYVNDNNIFVVKGWIDGKLQF